MAHALALAERGMGQTGLNPCVGCVIVKNGRIIGRGWTQPTGRPHAEAMALAAAGGVAKDATLYVTLEPCAHQSQRGPACVDLVIAAQPARVVIACTDPDPRTNGQGIAKLRAAGIAVQHGVMQAAAHYGLAGFISRIERRRPFITLKLATSLDGAIACANGSSQWITGPAARAHAHLERGRCDAILVGAGTYRADHPMLNVRLLGLENRSPRKIILGHDEAPAHWSSIQSPDEIRTLDCNHVLIEGGAMTAASFIRAGLVDRLLLYRAPIIIGGGKPCIGDIGLQDLGTAHGQWHLHDRRLFAPDTLEVYLRNNQS